MTFLQSFNFKEKERTRERREPWKKVVEEE